MKKKIKNKVIVFNVCGVIECFDNFMKAIDSIF